MKIPKEKLLSLPHERGKALIAAQKMRRVESAYSGSGMCYCISCGKPFHWKEMDGGHFIPKTIRITELILTNIWPQCKTCNGPLRGNVAAYEINLRKKRGDDEVDRLIALRMAADGSEEHCNQLTDEDKELLGYNPTAQDYKDIAKLCNKRTREVIRDKGIA